MITEIIFKIIIECNIISIKIVLLNVILNILKFEKYQTEIVKPNQINKTKNTFFVLLVSKVQNWPETFCGKGKIVLFSVLF